MSNYSKQLMLEKTGLVELPHAVIPLGVYRRLTSKPDCGMTRTGERRSLLFFGNLRSYKAVISLVEAFSETHDRELQLTIAGRCEDAELAACLKRNAESDSRIRLLLKFIPDEELEQLIESADGIVIPYTGSLNSGVAFLALTYGKPVLCPKTPTFTELAGDFDTGQFHLFEPPLRAQQLSDFNRKLKNGPGPSPCIPEKYSWPVIADQHNAYFKTLLSE